MKKNYPLYDTVLLDDFRQMVENAANNFKDKVAFSYKDDPRGNVVIEKTFKETRDNVRNLATKLLSLGAYGKHIALVGESSYKWICSYYSVIAMGSVLVPIDKELPWQDIMSIIDSADCEYVIYSGVIDNKIQNIKNDLNKNITYITMMSEVEDEKTLIYDNLLVDGEELFKNGYNQYYDNKIDPNKLASIVYTSGTTGKGKGVMLSQTNILSDMSLGMYNFKITDRTMMVLPPHHTFGSTVMFVGHFCQGCHVYLSSGLKFILNELKEFKPTHLVLVPLFLETFYKRIWSTAEKQKKDKILKQMIKLSNGVRKVGLDFRKKMFQSVTSAFGGELQMIICGGAALNQDIIDTFEGIGITILNGYGITECAPLISCNRNLYTKKGSVGLPIISEKVKIDNPDELGDGEICVKGPNVMLGYYKNEEATNLAFDSDGYFHTGDYGHLDEEGWIYITGRIKNLIILSNGKNVYPEEIETEISRVYGVNEVVVYEGLNSDGSSKDCIVAEIYPDFDSLKNHEITDVNSYFKEKIKKINEVSAPYKKVSIVKIRNTEFEKNTSKKIIRFKIDRVID